MKKILATLILVCSVCIANAQYENSKIKIGQKAPDIALTTPDGKTMKLSEINKGRIVLLDFWASWCHPCRMSNPGLVKMYKEFNDKKFKNAPNGFTVVSISLDKYKDAWVKAIADDGLVWPYHLSDLGYWTSKAAETYGIEFIPQSFLIDANGKVLGKYNIAETAADDIKKLEK